MLTQTVERGDAVHAGHHHVQQRQMDVLAVDDLECLRAVSGLKHAIALSGEVDAQRGDDILFVVADKNVIHGFLLRK